MLKSSKEGGAEWFIKELEQTTKRLGLDTSNLCLDLKSNSFQMDEVQMYLYSVTFEDLHLSARVLTVNLFASGLDKRGKLEKEIHAIMDEFGGLLVSFKEGNILGVESFFANVEVCIERIKTQIEYFAINQNKELTMQISHFFSDIGLCRAYVHNHFAYENRGI